jgi:transcriptional antiterminator RfaH
MPILAREADVYPEGLLDRPELGREGEVQWWGLYTLSRREKEAMRRFRGLDVPFYAPLVARQTRSPAGRVREAYLPLFSSYVFVYGDASVRYRALTSNCISHWVPVPDGAELTRDLRQVRRLIDSGLPLTPEDRLVPGMRVRVRSGPLQGVEGTVVQRANQKRLVVAVNFLAQGASLLLEDFQLERID